MAHSPVGIAVVELHYQYAVIREASAECGDIVKGPQETSPVDHLGVLDYVDSLVD